MKQSFTKQGCKKRGVGNYFSYAGAPWLTQKWVRKVKAAYCDVTPYGGYRDDEDHKFLIDIAKLVFGGVILAGMVVNIHSDAIIRRLRKPGDTRHHNLSNCLPLFY